LNYFSFKVHGFDRVWIDYKKRTNIERAVPRPFSLVNYTYKLYFNLIFYK